MENIASNIAYLRKLQNQSQEALAEALNVNRSRIGSYEEGRSEPPIEMLRKLSKHFHVSIDALVNADLRKVEQPQDLIKVGENRLLFPILVDKDGKDLIEVVPIKARAGYVGGYADPEFIEQLLSMKLPFVPTGKHRAFPIIGDSMPPLRDGSYVVARYVESLSELKDKATYIVVTKSDGFVYKRIETDKNNPSTLYLHSDNKAYRTYTVSAEEVLELWEYTCAINIGPYKAEELNPESILSMLHSLQVEVKEIQKRI
ncbi:MAG: LexA family transcriptional regulator [Bacteroidia bacterium]|nr:LexA family transcriptional regulator [Bacteroidia bacterium]